MMNELKATRVTLDPSSPNGSANVSPSTLSPASSPGSQAAVGALRGANLGETATTTIDTTADNEPSDTGNLAQTYGGMITIEIAGACIGITMFVIYKVFRRLGYRSLVDLIYLHCRWYIVRL